MHIREHKGRWVAIVELPPKNGKRQRKWIYGDSEAEVKKKAKKLEYEVSDNKYVHDSNVLLKVYLEEWFKNHKLHLSPYTQDGYKINIYTHIIPHAIGNIKLGKLTSKDIQDFVTEKLTSGRIKPQKDGNKGLSNRTVQYIIMVLKESLKDAVKHDLISKNPCDLVTTPKVKRAKLEVLDEKSIVKFLSLIEGEPLEVAVVLAVGLGLRRGEVLGLKWNNVDLTEKKININEALIQTKDVGVVSRDPKSEDSIREIFLPEHIINILEKQLKRQEADRIFFEDEYIESGFVVTNDDGTHITPHAFTKKFKALITKLNVNTTFHGLRHAFATLQLKYGSNIKAISATLGHSTTSFTQDRYQHVLDDIKKEIAGKMDRRLFKKSSKGCTTINTTESKKSE